MRHLYPAAAAEEFDFLIYFRYIQVTHVFNYTQNWFIHFLGHTYRFSNYHSGKVLGSEYNYYAGMNYINLDSLQKAKTYLTKAIKQGLDDKLKSKAQSALSRL